MTVAVLADEVARGEAVRDADVVRRVTRGSGAGGQNRNKVETAVVLTHVPTGTVVRSEGQRSRVQNERVARETLAARVDGAARGRQRRHRARVRAEQVGTGQRADKRRTVAIQRDEVVDHVTGRRWRWRDYRRGEW